MRFTLSVSIPLVIILSGCAAVPREQAIALATRGADASDLAAADVRRLAQRLDDVQEMNAFYRTYATCDATSVDEQANCKPVLTLEDTADQAALLVAAIDQRAVALTELGDTYRALKTEAEYDAQADLQGALTTLATSVNTYSALIDRTAPIVSAPVTSLISRTAGLWAGEQQRRRLMEANESIGSSVRVLRLALEKEAGIYDGLSEQFARNESSAREVLFEAGLIQRAPTLAPMTASLGVTLSTTAEATLNTNTSARIATQAYLEARSLDDIRRQKRRYQVLIAGLERLETAHKDFAEKQTFGAADFDRLMLELTALLTDIRGTAQ